MELRRTHSFYHIDHRYIDPHRIGSLRNGDPCMFLIALILVGKQH